MQQTVLDHGLHDDEKKEPSPKGSNARQRRSRDTAKVLIGFGGGCGRGYQRGSS